MADEKTHQQWVSATEFHTAQPSEDLVVQKFVVGVSKADEDDDSRRVRFIISTGAVDRDNDTIAVEGWELGAFKENPVVLWAHSRSDLPIGRAVNIGVEDGKLIADVEFADFPKAQQVLDLVNGGFLRASSVGFKPLEFDANEERGGVDFKRQELVEFSIVPVPSNPEALIAAAAKGMDLEIIRKWLAETLVAWPGELKLPGKAWDKVMKGADDEDAAPVEKVAAVEADDPSDDDASPDTQQETACPVCAARVDEAGSEHPEEGEDAPVEEVASEPEVALVEELDVASAEGVADETDQTEEAGDEVTPDPEDDVVFALDDEEVAEEDELVDVDLVDLKRLIEEASRQAFKEAVETHTASEVEYHRGRV